MIRRRLSATAGLVALAALLFVTACVELKHTGPTSPTEMLQAFAGSWGSSAAVGGAGIDPGTCGNFEWQITERTSTSAAGTFKATCAGGINLIGTAQGTLNGTTVNWSAAGNAGPSGVTCPFSITGTAAPEGVDGIRVNYSGSTCLGPISGSELLKKR
jgi:hypothetical protein